MVPPTPRLRASDIMEPNLTYVYPHTRVQSLVSILRTTVHHAFPVVTENRGNEKEFMKGNQLISNNIKFKVEPRPKWELVTLPCMTSSRRHGYTGICVAGGRARVEGEGVGEAIGHDLSCSWEPGGRCLRVPLSPHFQSSVPLASRRF